VAVRGQTDLEIAREMLEMIVAGTSPQELINFVEVPDHAFHDFTLLHLLPLAASNLAHNIPGMVTTTNQFERIREGLRRMAQIAVSLDSLVREKCFPSPNTVPSAEFGHFLFWAPKGTWGTLDPRPQGEVAFALWVHERLPNCKLFMAELLNFNTVYQRAAAAAGAEWTAPPWPATWPPRPHSRWMTALFSWARVLSTLR
jgi:hypothetical protein